MALARLGRSLPAAPVLGLCPGAEYGPAKRWPAEYFADVAQAKLAEGWEVWLFGSDNDAPVTGAIQSMTGKRCLDLGGKTSFIAPRSAIFFTQMVAVSRRVLSVP